MIIFASKFCTMDLGELNKILRQKAVDSGLCEKWQQDWQQDWSKGVMLEKFLDGIDFCLSHNYPDKSFIKENFTKEELRNAAILVDDAWSLVNPRQSVLLGNSTSTLRYNGLSVGRVHICDNSKAKVVAKNRSFVIVHLVGNAAVDAETDETGRITIIRHDEHTSIETTGNVSVKKEFGLYSNSDS